MSDLVERLLGVYRVPITDGLGPAGGDEPDNENYFVQTFPTTPIQVEAAREIERLQAENAEKKTMLLNQAKTIKETQAENDALMLDLQASDCLHVSAYQAGLAAGWNYRDANDEEGFAKARSSSDHIAELKRVRRARAAYEGKIK